jgi:dynein light chain roadblock-type
MVMCYKLIQSEVEETLKRLQNHKGVQGIIILNTEGVPIKSTLPDSNLTSQYSALISQIMSRTKSAIKELDNTV